MKRVNIIIGICLLLASYGQSQKYYYSFDEKIFLSEVPNKFVIGFDKQYLTEIETSLQSNGVEFQMGDNYCILTMENTNLETVKAFFSKQGGIKSINPMYIAADYGSEIVVTDEIVVQFKTDVQQQIINEMHEEYQVVVKEATKHFQILSVPFGLDPLEIANIRAESR